MNFSINFNKVDKVQQQQDLANSAVRRALQEEESGGGFSRGVAGMSEFQENRQYASKDHCCLDLSVFIS